MAATSQKITEKQFKYLPLTNRPMYVLEMKFEREVLLGSRTSIHQYEMAVNFGMPA